MDPLWLSLIAIVFVIVGVLVIRLHPFLALTFGALLVAICTPASQLQRLAIQEAAHRIVGVDGASLELESGRLIPGTHYVYRRHAGQRALQEVGEIELQIAPETETAVTIRAGETLIEPGDWALSAAHRPAAQRAAVLPAGQRLATGFGETCRKIGILIAMASVIGLCLLESGAARRIVDWIRDLVGERRTPVAFAISGFIVGIPVFFDTVFYLLMPLAKAMRAKTGGNYLLYVMSIVVGATMAHSLVPPTPGPLLVAAEIEGVTVGNMIIGGIIVGLISVSAGFLYCLWANRIWQIPLRDDLTPMDEVAATQVNIPPPPVFLAVLPILLPVILLSGKTLVDSIGDGVPSWLASARPLIEFLGDKNIALVVAAVVALAMLARQRMRAGNKNWFEGIQPALQSGGVIILITAAGGAFGQALRQCGVAEAIQQRFPATQSDTALLALAFVVTAVVRFAQGSATVAMITSVSIVAPLAAAMSLSYHPVYLALAIGCGSKPLPWMNDSGFWIVGRMSGMTEAETLKTFSVTLTIMGIVGFLVTLAGATWLPLVGPQR